MIDLISSIQSRIRSIYSLLPGYYTIFTIW